MNSWRLWSVVVVAFGGWLASNALARPAQSAKAKAPKFKVVKANAQQIAAAEAVLKTSADCTEAVVEGDHAFVANPGTDREQAFFPAASVDRVCLVYRKGTEPLGVYLSDAEPPTCIRCSMDQFQAISFPDLNGDGRRDVTLVGEGIVGWDPQGVGPIGGQVFFAWTMTDTGPLSVSMDLIENADGAWTESGPKPKSLRSFNKDLASLVPKVSPTNSSSAKVTVQSGPPPNMSLLHFVDGKVVVTELQSRKSRVLPLGKVLAMTSDEWGNWWILREAQGGGEIVWLPPNLDLKKQKLVQGWLELVTPSKHPVGRFQVKAGQWAVELTTFATYEMAEANCGTVDGSGGLCSEAAGWGSPETRTVTLNPRQVSAFGLNSAAPRAESESVAVTVTLPDMMEPPTCECWGEYADCGSGTMFGTSGVGAVLTSIECGDLAHMGCVLTTKSGDRFGNLGDPWIQRAHLKKGSIPGGSCGPYWVSRDGAWLSDGRGVFCAVADLGNCTAAVPGRFLGVGGKPLLKFSR